jgi:lauroyl/myristoyl acyltransferase
MGDDGDPPAKKSVAHQVVPARLAPAAARWWVGRRWKEEAYRGMATAEMEFLLEHSERAGEAKALARSWAEQMQVRSILRWHPRAIARQEVRGIEHLTSDRDPDRGVVLNFMHHHHYEGIFGALRRHGPRITVVVAPQIYDAPRGSVERRYGDNMAMGGELIRSKGGIEALAERLRRREILAIATDFPGQTEMRFLGRRVLGGFGAPRLAHMTNSRVVVVTTERDGTTPYVQLHEALDPTDYDRPIDLLEEILRRHERAVLAWPEATDCPTRRFAVPEQA